MPHNCSSLTSLSWLVYVVILSRPMVLFSHFYATDLQLCPNSNKSSKSHLGRANCHRHGREWTRPLHVLAVQCPLQTSLITRPPVDYIHTKQTDTFPFKSSMPCTSQIFLPIISVCTLIASAKNHCRCHAIVRA